MGFIALKCPNCAGDINFDMDRNFGFCNYCGTKLMRDDVVTANLNINNDTEIRSCLELAKESILSGKIKKCMEYVEKARTLDNSTADSFYLLAACKKMNSEESSNYIERAKSASHSLDVFTMSDYEKFELVPFTFNIPSFFMAPIPKSTDVFVDDEHVDTIKDFDKNATFYLIPGKHVFKVVITILWAADPDVIREDKTEVTISTDADNGVVLNKEGLFKPKFVLSTIPR